MNSAQAQKFNRILVIEKMTSSLANAEMAIAMMSMDEAEKAEFEAFRANR